MATPQKRYIVWQDFGTEGWMPNEFDTAKEAMLYIREGLSNAWVLTKQLAIYMEE